MYALDNIFDVFLPQVRACVLVQRAAPFPHSHVPPRPHRSGEHTPSLPPPPRSLA